jgi:hypothetical protein
MATACPSVQVRALALGLALLAGACSSAVRPEVLQAWVGRPASALRQEWGPPTREVAADAGQRLWIYEQVERRTGGTFATTQSASRWDDPAVRQAAEDAARRATNYVRSYLFWVGPDGAVARAEIREP